MADGVLSSILLLILLIMLHGVLQICYAALANYRHTPMRERSELGDLRAKNILTLSDDLSRLNSTIRLTLTFVRFAIVAVAYAQIAQPLAASGDPAVVTLVVLGVTALLTYMVGDVLALALGQAYADQLVGIVAPPIRALTFVLTPLAILAMRLSNAISNLTGGETFDKADAEEEIMTLVEESQQSGGIEDAEKEMIYSVLQFGETLARELMVPRPDLTAVQSSASLDDALKKFIDSGHSRIPVYEGDIDNIRGLLYAKDLLRLYADGKTPNKTISELMRPAYFVPETKRADVLFKEMQHRKTHLAVIVDEYGGTAGIATIEDLVEEILGDIKDEYDSNEEDEYVKVDENAYRVDGSINVDDLNALLDIQLPDSENDSLGGYIYSQLGRVPEVGDTVEKPGLIIRIEAVENRRIRKVYIAKVPIPSEVSQSEVPENEETRETIREQAESTPPDPIEPFVRSAS